MTGPAPGLREPLTTFFAATAVSSALYWTAPHLPFLSANLHGFIAIIFLYAPSLAARASGRPFDYQASGLHAAPIGFNLALAGLAALLTWPLFVGLVLGGYGLLCRAGLPPMLRDVVVPFCARWTGLSGMRLRFPDNFFLLAITQLVVIAIPEELFFRGYLMSRLEQRWPSRRRFLGCGGGMAPGRVQRALRGGACPGRLRSLPPGGVLPRAGVRLDAGPFR